MQGPLTRWQAGTAHEVAGRVYLAGGRNSLSRRVAAQLRNEGYQVTRLAGDNRYATAVRMAHVIDRRRPADIRHKVFLVTGNGFADAVPASAAAAAHEGVVLLTNGSRMSRATAAYLADHPDAQVYAVG